MNNKQTIKIILFALVVIVVVTMLNPLRRSTEDIRESMLRLTPVGTSMEEVLELIDSKDKWGKPYINYKHGYSLDANGDVSYIRVVRTVGVQSIDVVIGEYKTWLIVGISVRVFWGFDEDGKLVDVGVWKSMLK